MRQTWMITALGTAVMASCIVQSTTAPAVIASVWSMKSGVHASPAQTAAYASPPSGRILSKQELPQPVMPTLPPQGAQLAYEHGLHELLAQRTTNFHHASASQGKNMVVLANRLNGVVVKPGATFSYYRTVGPYTQENGFYWGRAFSGARIVPSMGGGVCQGASTLYSALLRTDLLIVERHQHSLTVPYLPPGEDATVAGTYLNFQFKNSRSTPVMIAAAADLKQRYLTVAIWGKEPTPSISVRHQVLETYPFQTVRTCDKTLAGAASQVQSPGQPGAKVKTWAVTKTADGTKEKYIGLDTYRPSPRIVRTSCEHGSNQ